MVAVVLTIAMGLIQEAPVRVRAMLVS